MTVDAGRGLAPETGLDERLLPLQETDAGAARRLGRFVLMGIQDVVHPPEVGVRAKGGVSALRLHQEADREVCLRACSSGYCAASATRRGSIPLRRGAARRAYGIGLAFEMGAAGGGLPCESSPRGSRSSCPTRCLERAPLASSHADRRQ